MKIPILWRPNENKTMGLFVVELSGIIPFNEIIRRYSMLTAMKKDAFRRKNPEKYQPQYLRPKYPLQSNTFIINNENIFEI